MDAQSNPDPNALLTLQRLACLLPKEPAAILCLQMHGGCMCKEDLAAFLKLGPKAMARTLARLADPVTACVIVESHDAGTVHLRPAQDWKVLAKRHWRPAAQRALPFPPGLPEAMAATSCPGSAAVARPEPTGEAGGADGGQEGQLETERIDVPQEPTPTLTEPEPNMKPKIDSWMPLYIGDYLADTGRLSTEAHGAYLLLLMDYWRNRRPLPDDDAQLAAIAKLPIERWRVHKPVLRGFFSVTTSGWVNKRIEAELQRANKVAESRSKAAKARWDKAGQAAPDANAYAGHVQTTSQPQPQNRERETPAAGSAGGSARPGRKPASVEETVAHGGVIGVSEADARAWYRDAEACGWSRGDGTPYDNWRRQMVIHRDFLTLNRQKHHGHQQHSSKPARPGVDRGAGTLNAGAASQYRDLGTVV